MQGNSDVSRQTRTDCFHPHIISPLVAGLTLCSGLLPSQMKKKDTDVSCNCNLNGLLHFKVMKGDYLQAKISASGTPVISTICTMSSWFLSPCKKEWVMLFWFTVDPSDSPDYCSAEECYTTIPINL